MMPTPDQSSTDTIPTILPILEFARRDIVELRHALAPNGLEVIEELASALEPRAVRGDLLLAAVCTLLNETT